jgi:hypothetical protein
MFVCVFVCLFVCFYQCGNTSRATHDVATAERSITKAVNIKAVITKLFTREPLAAAADEDIAAIGILFGTGVDMAASRFQQAMHVCFASMPLKLLLGEHDDVIHRPRL